MITLPSKRRRFNIEPRETTDPDDKQIYSLESCRLGAQLARQWAALQKAR